MIERVRCLYSGGFPWRRVSPWTEAGVQVQVFGDRLCPRCNGLPNYAMDSETHVPYMFYTRPNSELVRWDIKLDLEVNEFMAMGVEKVR